jgi:N-acetylglucosaminyldiphosphoundecaprenol N-acetyl-beta-D-mannosaminyltransferase
MGLQLSTLQLGEIILSLRNTDLPTGIAYHLVNAYTVVLAHEKPELFRILDYDFNICDGKPLAVVMQCKGSRLTQIRGADLMREALSDANSLASHFFLGSTDEVLSDLVLAARSLNPRINIVGQFSPEYKSEFDLEINKWVDLIQKSGASTVWIGLGTPKQDYVAHRIARLLPVHALAVGAAFDFLSKNQTEAPLILSKLGLEWVFRLIREPKRLASRYFIGNFKFLRIVFISFFGKRGE